MLVYTKKWPDKLKKIGGLLISAIVSYFINFTLDWLFFEKKREVLHFSKVISIDRPEISFEVYIIYLFSAVLSIGIFIVILSFYKRMSSFWKVTNLFVVSIIVAILILSTTKNILFSTVRPVMEASGAVYDKKRYCYLFIRPVMSNQCWLQEPIPLMPDQNGKWRAGAYFGGKSGQRFELIAIASKIKLDPKPFLKPGSYSCKEIPAGVNRFVRVVQFRD